MAEMFGRFVAFVPLEQDESGETWPGGSFAIDAGV